MNFLHQDFRQLSFDRQTDIQNRLKLYRPTTRFAGDELKITRICGVSYEKHLFALERSPRCDHSQVSAGPGLYVLHGMALCEDCLAAVF